MRKRTYRFSHEVQADGLLKVVDGEQGSFRLYKINRLNKFDAVVTQVSDGYRNFDSEMYACGIALILPYPAA